MEPAAPPGGLRRSLIIEIARKEILPRRPFRMPDNQLARLATGNIDILFIDNANFQSRHRLADRSGTDLSWRMIITQTAKNLRHSPLFDQGHAETRLECRMKFRLDTGTHSIADLVGTVVLAGRLIHQHRNQHTKIMK